MFCLHIGTPYLIMSTHGTDEATADDQIQLRCTVRTIEGLVVGPSLKWSGVGVGDSAVTESETVVVSERESERHFTFNPLKTSHGGRYRCTATISISSNGLYEHNSSIYTSVVKSKR